MRTLIATAFSLLTAGTVSAAEPATVVGSAYDHVFQSIDGKQLPLSEFRGKVLLVVNTASFCGFTQQYSALQSLYVRYEPQGLVVIGVPSNDFGGQEPNAEAEVKQFCQGAFGITFPLTAKYAVRGAGRHSFYAWAADALGSMNAPWWNFHKYLVGRDGKIVRAFGTRTEPLAADVVKAVEDELSKPAPQAALAK